MIFFIIAAIIFIYTDLNQRKISNWIMFPVLIYGLIVYQNWIAALIMLSIGVYLACPRFVDLTILEPDKSILDFCLFRGGDVKMLMLCGAFLGYKAIFVCYISLFMVKLFRKYYKYDGKLPFAPFIMPTALIFLVATKAVALILH